MVRPRTTAVAFGAIVAIVSVVRFAAAATMAASVPATCTTAVGEPVMLRSSDFDPDVLVWDSRDRAIEYAAGLVRSATDVLNHTVLSKMGTRAVVISCLPATVRPKYSNDILDTIGVKLTTGPHRGHYGWVSSDDIRGAHTAQSPAMQ